MRNSILLMTGILASLSCFAQETVEPVMKPGVYALKISPNGKWVGSMAGDASVYNVETGENVYHPDCYIGLGNAVANNGMVAADSHDVAVILYNGKTIYPETLGEDNYWFCDINAITPDAKTICGIVNNEDKDPTLYVPFVAEVDGDGNVGEPTILPFPDVDFFGAAPQYVTAVWISDDGQTIVGQVLDWRGYYTYPIYYTKDSEGKWGYTLPSEGLFNPTHIELPKNPWLDEPEFPEPADFLTGNRKEAYDKAYQDYLNGAGAQPNAEEYMTPEQMEEYEKAVEDYNAWYYGNQKKIQEYVDIYKEVLKTSPSFSANEIALDPAGNYFVTTGGVVKEDNVENMIYKFGITSNEIKTINMPESSYYPIQVLKDGTIIITKPLDQVPNSYLLLPGSENFISLQEYFEPEHPELADWLDEMVPGGAGVVCMNEDQTVITGALVPDQLADSDYEDGGYYYHTYFILLENAGIESVVAEDADGLYRVYDLKGVKVLETKDASVVNNLPKGIYIVNGKKILK